MQLLPTAACISSIFLNQQEPAAVRMQSVSRGPAQHVLHVAAYTNHQLKKVVFRSRQLDIFVVAAGTRIY